MKKDIELVDFANEGHAWRELTYVDSVRRGWLFHIAESRNLLSSDEVRSLGHKWYSHSAFSDYQYEAGMNRILTESDNFFASLGYEHIGRSGRYKITNPKYERVAMFAHQGFGLAFLSTVLDIAYPDFCTKFDFTHTGMTVIEFKDEGDGTAIPCVLALSLDSHLYKDGLPTKYGNRIYF